MHIYLFGKGWQRCVSLDFGEKRHYIESMDFYGSTCFLCDREIRVQVSAPPLKPIHQFKLKENQTEPKLRAHKWRCHQTDLN